MLKGEFSNQNSEDFVGIAVLNTSDVKLGKHPYEVDLYKNQ